MRIDSFRAPSPSAGRGNTQIVKRGDTLSAIARDNGVSLPALIKANPQLRDPDRIFPGQEIHIPSAPAAEDPAPPPFMPAPPDLYAPPNGTPVPPHDISPPRGPEGPTLEPGVGAKPEPLGAPRVANGDLGMGTLRALLHQRLDAPAGTAGVGPATPPISGPKLREGSSGTQVNALQTRLGELGYAVKADSSYGRLTAAAVRQFQVANGLKADGVVGRDTMAAINGAQAAEAPKAGVLNTQLDRYPPNSPEAIALFEQAAKTAGLPTKWAASPALHEILRRESNGNVGQPNYTYGDRAKDHARWSEVHDELKAGKLTTRSSATGLGQLLLANVRAHYPSGVAGIGDPVEEAAGMLNYIHNRYGDPEAALTAYGTRHEGY